MAPKKSAAKRGAELLPEAAEPKAKAAKAAAKTPKANGSQDPALMANLASGKPGGVFTGALPEWWSLGKTCRECPTFQRAGSE